MRLPLRLGRFFRVVRIAAGIVAARRNGRFVSIQIRIHARVVRLQTGIAGIRLTAAGLYRVRTPSRHAKRGRGVWLWRRLHLLSRIIKCR